MEKVNYNEKYYIDIWRAILKKYSVDSPVRDLGDVFRAFHLVKYLRKAILLLKTSDHIVIHDYGSGNWLYLGEVLKVLGSFKNRQFKLVGHDYSREALDFGIKKYKKNIPSNVVIRTRSGDFIKHLDNIPPKSVDIVICLETLEHIHDDKKIFTEFVRILKSNGSLIVSVPNKQPLLLSKNWFLYVLARKKFTEKDRVVGHLRRYTANTLLNLNEGRLIYKDGSFYGFLLSDYLKDVLKILSRWPVIHELVFCFVRKILLLEDRFFNKVVRVNRSEGMFMIFRKF